jgi:hypothetical protein
MAAQAQVSDADKRCLGCHSRRGLFKRLENSDHMTMVVPADLFAKSEHAANACTDCHTDVNPGTHLQTRKSIKSARDYSLASVVVCQKCHEKESAAWQNSIHATLVGAGNARGPVCTSCHDAHTEIKGAPVSLANVPCKSCHDTIFAAYVGSVHGHASSDGKTGPLLCSGCHNAHDVSVASSPTGPKNACIACHQGVLQKHQAWLPNAALHFDVVSCPACHAPTAPRRVDLQLVDSGAQTRVQEKAGVPTFQTPGTSVDAIALYNLLRQTTNGHAVLRGRLEVSTAEQIHQLTPKSQAISDCNTCHSAGSDAFKSVTISVAGPDGLPVRYVTDKDVLRSVMSIGSIGGFYAVGGTRIGLLDILLILAGVVGIGVPGAHLMLGVVVRRHLRAHDAASARRRPE